MEKKYRVPRTAITEKGLKKLIKEAAKAHSSVGDWARENDISPQQVSAFLRKTQGAGLKIPEILGYKPQLIFLPLDEEDIATAYPSRNATKRPQSKTDRSRPPINARGKKTDDREDTKKKLRERRR